MRKPITRKNEVRPDFKYRSQDIAKFINHVMQGGKKTVARNLVYEALDIIEKEVEDKKPEDVFDEALKNVGPSMEVRSRRIGGANYQVPRPTGLKRRVFLSMTWIVKAARSKTGTPMARALADELIAAYNEEGEAFSKKVNMHKMAEANKAFAHFAR